MKKYFEMFSMLFTAWEGIDRDWHAVVAGLRAMLMMLVGVVLRIVLILLFPISVPLLVKMQEREESRAAKNGGRE